MNWGGLIPQEWEEIIETHYLPTPDTVGISATSEKVRIDEGTVDGNTGMLHVLRGIYHIRIEYPDDKNL